MLFAERRIRRSSLTADLRASRDERLLGFALRDYFWFLVCHFWLLSKAFASLLFVFIVNQSWYPPEVFDKVVSIRHFRCAFCMASATTDNLAIQVVQVGLPIGHCDGNHAVIKVGPRNLNSYNRVSRTNNSYALLGFIVYFDALP